MPIFAGIMDQIKENYEWMSSYYYILSYYLFWLWHILFVPKCVAQDKYLYNFYSHRIGSCPFQSTTDSIHRVFMQCSIGEMSGSPLFPWWRSIARNSEINNQTTGSS